MDNKLPQRFTVRLEPLLKNKKLTLIVFVGILGMMLVAFGTFGSKQSEEKPQSQKNEQTQSSFEDEKNLSQFLKCVEGAGRVEVMITYESGGENVYAVDVSENSLKGENGKEEIKNSSEHIIIKNQGNENGLEIKEIYPKIRGVAVICDGGNNPVIKEQITKIVCALFNINSNQVSVARMAA